MLSDSQNSPSLVAPSPVVTSVIASDSGSSRRHASAHPTACRNCVPVGEDPLTMFSGGDPQCEGIWRPPEAGIGFGAHGLQQHFFGSHAERQAQGAVAIIGIKPVVPGPQSESGGGADGFMPGAADLEINPVLALEKNLPVVDAAGEIHDAKSPDQFIAPEPGGECAEIGLSWSAGEHLAALSLSTPSGDTARSRFFLQGRSRAITESFPNISRRIGAPNPRPLLLWNENKPMPYRLLAFRAATNGSGQPLRSSSSKNTKRTQPSGSCLPEVPSLFSSSSKNTKRTQTLRSPSDRGIIVFRFKDFKKLRNEPKASSP